MTQSKAFNDIAPTRCYGCGTLNDHGLHFKSYWDEDAEKMTCRWSPQPYHEGGLDFLYGGIIASLIDCQFGLTASAAIYREEKRPFGDDPYPYAVTANLNINYLAPIPIDAEVHSECWVETFEGRKIQLACHVSHDDTVCVKSTALYIKLIAGTGDPT